MPKLSKQKASSEEIFYQVTRSHIPDHSYLFFTGYFLGLIFNPEEGSKVVF
jgi:hypothetical protein